MAMERLAIGATVAALGLASCGSSNESPPLKEVPPPAVTSTYLVTATGFLSPVEKT